jgi:hypothetical protein
MKLCPLLSPDISILRFTDAVPLDESAVLSAIEHRHILEFCRQPGGLALLKFQDLLDAAGQLAALATNADSQTAIVSSLKKILPDKEESTVLRGLLLLEKILEEGIVSLHLLFSLRHSIEGLKSVECKHISMKASKILKSLEYFRQSKAA